MSIAIPFHDHILHLQPSKVIAVGLNYKDHIQESLSVKVRGFDTEEPEEPVLFAKLPSCIIGNGDTIQLPSIVKKYNFHSTRTDYEGELAVVLGKTGKDIHPAEALDYVMGITCAT